MNRFLKFGLGIVAGFLIAYVLFPIRLAGLHAGQNLQVSPTLQQKLDAANSEIEETKIETDMWNFKNQWIDLVSQDTSQMTPEQKKARADKIQTLEEALQGVNLVDVRRTKLPDKGSVQPAHTMLLKGESNIVGFSCASNNGQAECYVATLRGL